MLAVDFDTSSVQTYVANVNWAQPSWDLFIILFFIIAGFLYGLSLGRDRVIVILVSVYMALAVVNAAPFIGQTAEIQISSLFAVKITAFLAAFVVLFFLLSRSALLSTIASSDNRGSWWQVLLFSFLHVGLLTSVTLSFLPENAVNGLAPLTRTLFATPNANFLWILSPLLAMMLFKGGASDKKKFKYDV